MSAIYLLALISSGHIINILIQLLKYRNFQKNLKADSIVRFYVNEQKMTGKIRIIMNNHAFLTDVCGNWHKAHLTNIYPI